jgi:hypothetical protein
MIDTKLFTVERLVAALLDTSYGNHNKWWSLVEIIPDYMPPYPQPGTRPRCVVKCKKDFLRHSAGPSQGHFWDVYGDDYLTPELALLAVVQAPIPPFFIDKAIWREASEAERLSKL